MNTCSIITTPKNPCFAASGWEAAEAQGQCLPYSLFCPCYLAQGNPAPGRCIKGKHENELNKLSWNIFCSKTWNKVKLETKLLWGGLSMALSNCFQTSVLEDGETEGSMAQELVSGQQKLTALLREELVPSDTAGAIHICTRLVNLPGPCTSSLLGQSSC